MDHFVADLETLVSKAWIRDTYIERKLLASQKSATILQIKSIHNTLLKKQMGFQALSKVLFIDNCYIEFI